LKNEKFCMVNFNGGSTGTSYDRKLLLPEVIFVLKF
jgi:hypothetical protein